MFFVNFSFWRHDKKLDLKKIDSKNKITKSKLQVKKLQPGSFKTKNYSVDGPFGWQTDRHQRSCDPLLDCHQSKTLDKNI